jgi:ABC-type transporter Mla subunit MlaD
MQEQAKGIGGYGRDLNDALGNLGPFAEDTADIVDILNRQEGAVRSLISNTGVVFDALSERDGQLRSLIENSNKVFAATASRDEELKQTFMALPTFERESALTLDRLTQFSRNANPLVTQLRPAARELSPTLVDLGELSPDLKRLFEELGPLIDASKAGFPAAEQFLRDARPFIAQLDPAMRQITPILQFIGLDKPQLTAFFANTVAATQAAETQAGKKIHYLRTTNPLNAENLAVYPRRVGTNRPNAYTKPGNFNQLKQGMPVFENRHCNNGVPAVTNVPLPPIPPALGPILIPNELLNNVITFAFGGTQRGGVAVPCRPQGRFNFGGEVTQYPHVRER